MIQKRKKEEDQNMLPQKLTNTKENSKRGKGGQNRSKTYRKNEQDSNSAPFPISDYFK